MFKRSVRNRRIPKQEGKEDRIKMVRGEKNDTQREDERVLEEEEKGKGTSKKWVRGPLDDPTKEEERKDKYEFLNERAWKSDTS